MFYYEDVLKALNRSKVDYVVFGGVAAILYGVHRTTLDIDIMIDLGPKNIEKFYHSLLRLGYRPKVPVTLEQLKDFKCRKMWMNEKNMKVLSFFHIKDDLKCVDVSIGQLMDYKTVKKRIVKVGGIKVPVIELNQLKKLKKKAGRPKDLADLDDLKRLEKLNDD